MVFGYSAIGIILAINNYGVISLIYAVLGRELLSLITLYLFGKAKISFKFNFEKLKQIFYYSGGIGLSNIFSYTANNADYVIIGKMLNPVSLGLYTRAFNIMTLPLSKISMTLFDVIFSVFSEIQNDVEQIKSIYLKTIKIIVIITFPVLSTMILGAELIINGIYGEKWSGAISVLQILCFAGFFKVVTNSAGAVAKSTGKVYSEALRQMIFAVLLIAGALIGVKYGIEGVGFAVVISSLWLYVSMAHLAIKILKMKWTDFVKAHIPGTLILIIITLINIITLNVMDNIFGSDKYILKLFVLMLLSSLMLLSLVKKLPVKIIGEEGRYLISAYLSKLKLVSKKYIKHVQAG